MRNLVNRKSNQSRRPGMSHPLRRGAAAVEFAIILPLFLMLVLGTVEMGSALNAAQILEASLREGGRLASMEQSPYFAQGGDPNAKVIQDIRNFLAASKIPGDEVNIAIVHAGGSDDGQTFDLDDPANDLRYFRIEASVPYESVSAFPLDRMTGQNIAASLTFRKGRSRLVSN
ncbi:MAG: pilus assembly protein [Planctomycetaceae bacterium]